jgi:hypothetical protein
MRDYKYRTGNSKFAQHLTEYKHTCGTINSTLKILEVIKKGTYMDTLERYHIHRVTSQGIQINDRSTISKNPLFDTLVQHSAHRGHPHAWGTLGT